jgi:hypothetical protein
MTALITRFRIWDFGIWNCTPIGTHPLSMPSSNRWHRQNTHTGYGALLHRVQSKLCVTTTRQRISCILCSTAQYHIHTLNPNTLNPKPFRQSTWLVSPQALHESQQSSEQQIHHHYKVHLCTWKRCFQGLPYKTRSLVAYENTIHSSSCDLV